MFCFQKYTRHLLKLILSPQSRHQSLSLGTIQVCNAVLCSPRGTTGVCHSCDECKKSTLPIVCDWSCTLVHWPKEVTTSNSCQLSMSINLRANFWQLSNWFNFLLFELLIIQIKMRNFVKLLHCLLCRSTVSFNTFVSVSLHVVRPRYCLCVNFLPSR